MVLVGCEWLLLSETNSPAQVCSCRVQVSVQQRAEVLMDGVTPKINFNYGT